MTAMITLKQTQITALVATGGPVDARQLWNSIGKPHRQFNKWVETYITKGDYGQESYDWFAVLEKKVQNSGGRPRKEYKVTANFAKELAMLSRTPDGKVVRRYFIEAEEYLHSMREILIQEYCACSSALNQSVLKGDACGLHSLYSQILKVKPSQLNGHLRSMGWDGNSSKMAVLVIAGYGAMLRTAFDRYTRLLD